VADLAALAGINVGMGGSTSVANIAYLQSDTLLIEYINNNKGLGQLFDDDWDIANKRWKEASKQRLPTIGKALRKLRNGMFSVSIDKKTGLITVSLRHHQPEVAAQWVNGLVAAANRNLRERDMSEGKRTIDFLQRQADVSTPSVELKQTLYRLVQDQMKRLAVASAREDYAFRIIDAARVPEAWERVAPVRRAIFAISVLIGGIFGIGIALIVEKARSSH